MHLLKKKDKRVLVNIASSILSVIANAMVFLLVTPFVRRTLGNDVNGVWWLIGTFASYLSIAPSAISTGIVKYVAEYKERGEDKWIEQLASTGFVLSCRMAGIALLPAIGLYALCDLVPAIHQSDWSTHCALAIMLSGVILRLPFVGIWATIGGMHRYYLRNFITILESILRAVGFVFLLRQGYGLLALTIWSTSLSLVVNFTGYVFLRFVLAVNFSTKHYSREMAQRIIKFSKFMVVSNIANMLYERSDVTVIGSAMAPAAVTEYGIGLRLLRHLQSLSASATKVLMPVVSGISVLTGQERQRKLYELTVRGSRFSAILVLPGFLFLLVLGRQFIHLWQGPDYADASVDISYWVFVILAVPHFFTYSQHIIGYIWIGLGLHRFPACLALITAIFNIGLSIILIIKYGIFGVAWSLAISTAIRRIILQVYFHRTFKISMRKYYWDAWGKLLPLSVFFACALGVQRCFLDQANLLMLLIVGIVNTIVFWLLSYWALDDYERKVLREILGKMVGKV